MFFSEKTITQSLLNTVNTWIYDVLLRTLKSLLKSLLKSQNEFNLKAQTD